MDHKSPIQSPSAIVRVFCLMFRPSTIQDLAVVKPAVQNTYKPCRSRSASGATFQCMQILPFLSIFSYLSYLDHTSLLGLQTKTRSIFFSFKFYNPETSMSSAVNVVVHAIHKRSKKCLAQKVDNLGSLRPIPMIQQPFNSSCAALRYAPGTKFYH